MGERATGQMAVEGLSAFIQARPQGSMGWVGLPEERVRRHRLMGALNDGMIGGTAFARKAHLYAERQQP